MVSRTVHLNCMAERMIYLYIYIFNFFLLCHLMERKTDARGASLGLQTPVRDLFSGSKAGGLLSWPDLGKKIQSERICLGFIFVSLPSRCAKPPSSLVKCFQWSVRACLMFVLEKAGSACIPLVLPLHQSHRARARLQNLLCWRDGIPPECWERKDEISLGLLGPGELVFIYWTWAHLRYNKRECDGP